jgi:hypothetical protein
MGSSDGSGDLGFFFFFKIILFAHRKLGIFKIQVTSLYRKMPCLTKRLNRLGRSFARNTFYYVLRSLVDISNTTNIYIYIYLFLLFIMFQSAKRCCIFAPTSFIPRMCSL